MSDCNNMATSTSLPTPKVIQVDTRGAVILGEESPEVSLPVTLSFISSHPHPHPLYAPQLDTRFLPSFYSHLDVQTRDSRGIYLPNYIEPVSHVAVDVSTFSPAPSKPER